MTEQDIINAINKLEKAYIEHIKNDYVFYGLKEECELMREICPGVECCELPKSFTPTEMKGHVYCIPAKEIKPIKVYIEE